MKDVIIIGSGVGGLATSIRMAKEGHRVQVFEANPYVGGKLTEIRLSGFRFDAGPSLFTMPQYVEELLENEKLEYQKLTEICRYFWPDGTKLNAKSDTQIFAQDLAAYLKEDKDQVLKYFEQSQKKYEISGTLFLENTLHSIRTWFSRDALKAYFKIPTLGIFTSLHRLNRRYFRNKKTIQLFDRYATYNGSDPYKCSGILSMIPHFEFSKGAYFPKNGMISIVHTLHKEAMALGVRFHLSTRVKKILTHGGTCIGIEVSSNKQYKADIVVSNMDVLNSYKYLLDDHEQYSRYAKQERSTSGLIFYWGIDSKFEQLDLHNIFFSQNYREEFQALSNGEIYEDPTIYVNISSKLNDTDAPDGCENWFVMINVPAGGYDKVNWIAQYRKLIISKLSSQLGVSLEDKIIVEDYLDPKRIENRTLASGGALYGTSSNNRNAAFFRQRNKSNMYKNLYFVGGSAHPGGGIPLCLLSAKITAQLINET